MFRSINSFFNMIFKSAERAETKKTSAHRCNKNLTPSYVLVAKDLESKEHQVFEAAVYYLCTIASFKKDYESDIVDILNKTARANKKQPTRVAYIEKMMCEKKLV